MKIVYEYSHLGGSEILHVHFPDHERDIIEVVGQVKAAKTKISNEKTMKGEKKYSPVDMNKQFKEAFQARGYIELKDKYTIREERYWWEISRMNDEMLYGKEDW